MGLGICVVGSGYVGTVVAACFASIGHRVVGLEDDEARLASLQKGHVPFFEPGLEQLVRAGLENGALRFSGEPGDALDDADIVFLCVGTPPGHDGRPDMRFVESAARAIGEGLTRNRVIVTKSTVPIGSGAWLENLIEESAPPRAAGTTRAFSVVSNPEFLREGSALRDFFYPDRVVLGSDDPGALDLVAEAYRPIIEQTFAGADPDRRPVELRTGLATAEAIKYAANAFLATKISFINEMAIICELVGADIRGVADAIGVDHRIGRSFLNAGLGWGGSCFGKDLDALAATARDYGFEPEILTAVRQVNRRQRRVVVDKLQRHLKTLRGRRIALLGLAFKPGTDDLRDAPAVELAGRLIERGATVTAHDPVVESVPDLASLRLYADPYDAVVRADAAVLVTEWGQFRELDFDKVREVMRGRLIIDGRNILDPAAIMAAGLTYEGIGHDGQRPAFSG